HPPRLQYSSRYRTVVRYCPSHYPPTTSHTPTYPHREALHNQIHRPMMVQQQKYIPLGVAVGGLGYSVFSIPSHRRRAAMALTKSWSCDTCSCNVFNNIQSKPIVVVSTCQKINSDSGAERKCPPASTTDVHA